MTVTGLAYALSALVGAGIIVIGARFLLTPRAAAAGYGIPARTPSLQIRRHGQIVHGCPGVAASWADFP